MQRTLAILGAGLVTDSFTDVHGLLKDNSSSLPPFDLVDPATLASYDTLAQLAFRAVHQAWTMAQSQNSDPQHTGLLFASSWGTIDSTVAYLESMLEADGKYASPRHFSRSVYSSAASALAIHYKIQGPCETLAFSQAEVQGALRQAWRLLSARRCNRVVIVWAEQFAQIAAEFTRLAATKLHRREYQRYVQRELGFGAVALIVSLPDQTPAIAAVECDCDPADSSFEVTSGSPPEKPFAMDAAVRLLRKILTERFPPHPRIE